jgi:hypothetical protein
MLIFLVGERNIGGTAKPSREVHLLEICDG